MNGFKILVAFFSCKTNDFCLSLFAPLFLLYVTYAPTCSCNSVNPWRVAWLRESGARQRLLQLCFGTIFVQAS